MMSVIGSILASGSFRRFLVWGVTTVIIAMNKKWGLDLDATEISALVAGGIAHLAQSGLKEAAMAKASAAVPDVPAAVAELAK